MPSAASGTLRERASMYGSVSVPITLPPAHSPQTTSTGDTLRVDEAYPSPRNGVFASAIHLRSGTDPMLARSPTCLVRSSRAYTEEAHPSSLLGRRLLFHSSAPPPSSRSPPSPFTSRIAQYPTSKAPPLPEALRPMARSQVEFDVAPFSRSTRGNAGMRRCQFGAVHSLPGFLFFSHLHPHRSPHRPLRTLVVFLGLVWARTLRSRSSSGRGDCTLCSYGSSLLFIVRGSVHADALPDAALLFFAPVSRSESLSVIMSLLTLISSPHLSQCICAVPS